MISQRSNDKVNERKNTIADNYGEKNTKCILRTSVTNDTRIGFDIEEHDHIDGGCDQNISAELHNINIGHY